MAPPQLGRRWTSIHQVTGTSLNPSHTTIKFKQFQKPWGVHKNHHGVCFNETCTHTWPTKHNLHCSETHPGTHNTHTHFRFSMQVHKQLMRNDSGQQGLWRPLHISVEQAGCKTCTCRAGTYCMYTDRLSSCNVLKYSFPFSATLPLDSTRFNQFSRVILFVPLNVFGKNLLPINLQIPCCIIISDNFYFCLGTSDMLLSPVDSIRILGPVSICIVIK